MRVTQVITWEVCQVVKQHQCWSVYLILMVHFIYKKYIPAGQIVNAMFYCHVLQWLEEMSTEINQNELDFSSQKCTIKLLLLFCKSCYSITWKFPLIPLMWFLPLPKSERLAPPYEVPGEIAGSIWCPNLTKVFSHARNAGIDLFNPMETILKGMQENK